jgi:multisubunit Na+/H+ antiporter MnhB subunit
VSRIERSLLAFAALAVAVISVMLALGTLPSRMEAQDSGRLVPWMISWSLAWVAVVSSMAVAGILLADPRRAK